MRKFAALALPLALLVSSAGAATLQTGVKLRVNPAVGRPNTTFQLEFKAPTGSGDTERQGLITLTGPSGSDCVSHETLRMPTGLSGSPDHVKLAPTGGQPWCSGTFHGVVEETIRPHCTPGRACPMFIAIVRVGHFQFAVRQ
jgi:hypothetical protein